LRQSKLQARVDRIARIDHPVAVPAVRWIVEDGEGEVTVRSAAGRLGREVAEKLREVIDGPVSVSVQRQPAVVPISVRPTHLLKGPSGENGKLDSIAKTGQMKAFVERIQDDWAATTARLRTVIVVAANIRSSAAIGVVKAALSQRRTTLAAVANPVATIGTAFACPLLGYTRRASAARVAD
jgi:hypothetical protein